jgi:hypothetical protein
MIHDLLPKKVRDELTTRLPVTTTRHLGKQA